MIKAKENTPHLILLDVMMPQMDGIETSRTADLGLKTLLSYFLPERGLYPDTSLDAGGDDYITKPINRHCS
ncbi:MAG: response regulator [Bacteroidales bacterium]